MAGSEQRPTNDVLGHGNRRPEDEATGSRGVTAATGGPTTSKATCPSGTWTPRPPTRTRWPTTPRATARVVCRARHGSGMG
jgi:hypothetical protein